MHITDPEAGLMVTTGIVGGGIPIAVGLALAAKMQNTGQICVVNFGDGATNIGAFHEGLNLASVWRLPIVFVCQNNEYGEYTPRRDSQTVEIWQRGAAYGMPGVDVDGNDAVAMCLAAEAATSRARRGDGPTLLDCRTFRFMGHFYGDPMVYMDKAELSRRMAEDPVDRLHDVVLSVGGATSSELTGLRERLQAEVEAAIEFALASPPPSPDDVFDDVYCPEVAS